MSENHHEHGGGSKKKSIIEIPERYWEDEELKRLARENHHSKYVDELWRLTGGDISFNAGELREYIESLPDLKKGFETDRRLRCVDGRTPGGVHAAGSFILIKHWPKALNLVLENNIEGITSHAQCGACGLKRYESWHMLSDQKKSQCNRSDFLASADVAGQGWAKFLASAAGIEYKDISPNELNGPSDFHPERSIFYADIPFDYSRVRGLQPGFTISPHLYSNSEYPCYELRTTLREIVFSGSGHTFEKKFNQSSPLYIICVAEDEKRLKVLQKEVGGVVEKKWGDKVQVSGFLRP